MNRFLLTTVSMGLLVAGCDSGESDADAPYADDQNAGTPMMGAAEPGAETYPASNLDPQSFVTNVAQSNQYEIDAARIALEKTRSNDVRDFANQMIEDHSKAAAKLKSAIEARGGELEIPSHPSDQQQADLESLRDAEDFDSVYLQQQRRAHEKALSLLRGYANGSETSALRSFADETATVVQGHLDRVRKIEVAAGEDGLTRAPADTGTQ